jgi:hypothetical protein
LSEYEEDIFRQKCAEVKSHMHWYFLQGFIEDSVYIPPLPSSVGENKMQKTEDCAKIDSILQKVCQEVPYLYFIT